MDGELNKSREELALMLNRYQQSVEEERINLARDLHDELGQALTALKIDLTMLWKKISSDDPGPSNINEEFEQIIYAVGKLMRSVKDISFSLRSQHLESGLIEAIKSYALEFEKRNKVTCRTILPSYDPGLEKNASIALFRIVQESLTNVARHSEATYVQVAFNHVDNHLRLEITDNGKGISESDINSTHSLGIIGLRERTQRLKGVFTIQKAGDRGTIVSAVIPLENLK